MRWPVVLLTLAISLAGLFGTGYLVKNHTVDQPLLQALSHMEALASYAVSPAGSAQEITVRLKPTADLKEAFAEVDGQARQILKATPYTIHVEDSRTPELEQVANRVDLYVQEGIATGEFAAMADRIEAEAGKLGAAAQVAVDSRRVYVALLKGQDYMYSVVERPVLGGAPWQEGGSGL